MGANGSDVSSTITTNHASDSPSRAIPEVLVVWLALLRGWISILLLAPAGLSAVFSQPHWRTDSWGYIAFVSLGWLLFMAGAAMRWWATLYVGGRKTMELVTDGPYSITRNPIYFGTFLLTLSVAALLQSAVFVLAFAVVAILYLCVTVPTEEKNLAVRHGEMFAAYRQRVPMFFPNALLFHSRTSIEIHVSGLRHEFIRTCRWAWIPILCSVVTHLRCEAQWPTWFSLP